MSQNQEDVARLFEVALRVDPEHRQHFLDSALRGGRESLRADIEELLAADARAEQLNFLATQSNENFTFAQILSPILCEPGAERIEHICQQFASALRSGRMPWIEDFLREESEADRLPCLAGLLRTELAVFAELRHPTDLAHYLERFPSEAEVVRRIFHEYSLSSSRALRANNSAFRSVDEDKDEDFHVTSTPSESTHIATPLDDGTRLDCPLHFSDDRYQVVRPLGVGGQKRVYLAHDRTLDRQVVIGIHVESNSQTNHQDSLRQEAALLARLGDHPNIVTIFDLGELNGCPYIISQFVNSGSLRELLAKNTGRPLPLERAAQVARQTCSALAYAHARGVLHLDVKPGNIWLMENGEVKLGDFGLARTWDLSQFAPGGGAFSSLDDGDAPRAAGTPAYMAPEQVLGRQLGPETDLYAIGIVLYEMVTGQRPFAASDMMTLVSQHLNMEPVVPSHHNPLVSHELDELIMALLGKDPSQRPADATAVAERLAWITSPAPRTRATAITSRQVVGLARGVFVGRQQELAELRMHLEQTLGGTAGSVILMGEPGSGKTRLAEELATYAQLRNVLVLRGRSYQGDGVPPLWPWAQTLRQLARTNDALSQLAQVPGNAAAAVATIDEELQQLLGPRAPLPDLDAVHARFRLFDAIAQWLASYAEKQPLLFLIDDLQWADEASLKLLVHLRQTLSHTKLLIVATCRDDAIRPETALNQTLGDLAREPTSLQMALPHMSLDDVRSFIALTIGRSLNEELAERVWRRTQGNPFFVSEVIRLLASERSLDNLDEVATRDLVIPPQVQQVVTRRLELLSETCRRALTVAAILGRRFELRILQSFFVNSASELLDALDEAIVARILEQPSRDYLFTHDLIRDTILGSLSTSARIDLHLQAAQILEQAYLLDLPPKLGELSHHYYHALPLADAAKVIECAIGAANYAREQLAYEEASAHLSMAIELVRERPGSNWQQLARLWVDKGEAQRRAGRIEPSLVSFREAIACANHVTSGDEMAEAVIGLEASLWQTNQVTLEAIAATDQAKSLLADDNLALHARLTIAQARAIYHTGGRERAMRLANDALSIARQSRDMRTLAQVLGCINHAYQGPRHLETRLDFMRQLLEVADSRQLREHRVEALIWQTIDRVAAGSLNAARSSIAKLLSALEQIRHPYYEYSARLFRVMLHILDAKLIEARKAAIAACQLGRRISVNMVEGTFGVQMFCIARELGHLQALLPQLEQIGRAQDSQLWLPGLLVAYAATGCREAAAERFETLAQNDFSHLAADGTYPLTLAYLTEVADFLHDEARAAQLYDRLIDYQHQTVIAGGATVCFGAASRFLGILSRRLRRFEAAEMHFQHALELNHSMGAVGWRAHTEADYAVMLLDRNHTSDRQRAFELASKARSCAEAFDLVALRDKTNRILNEIGLA